MFSRSDRLRPNTKLIRISGIESVKSSVDDFDMELGIVSVRVGLSYDPLRLSPCSGDLLTQIARMIIVFKKTYHSCTPKYQKQFKATLKTLLLKLHKLLKKKSKCIL